MLCGSRESYHRSFLIQVYSFITSISSQHQLPTTFSHTYKILGTATTMWHCKENFLKAAPKQHIQFKTFIILCIYFLYLHKMKIDMDLRFKIVFQETYDYVSRRVTINCWISFLMVLNKWNIFHIVIKHIISRRNIEILKENDILCKTVWCKIKPISIILSTVSLVPKIFCLLQ